MRRLLPSFPVMKKILLVCVLACLGFACWHQYQGTRRTDRPLPVEKPRAEQSKVAVATPVPVATIAVVPSPVPAASVAATRHVSPAGTFTKEQLLSAINKDANESALEDLLGPPAHRKSTNWSSFSVWDDKLDTGGDSPGMFTAEVAKYNGTALVVRIYDPASGSSTLLPWHDKVLQAYNEAQQARSDALVAYNNDLAAKQAAQAQLELYKHAAADTQRWMRSQNTQYVSPLSLSAAQVGGSGDCDQPGSTPAPSTVVVVGDPIGRPPPNVGHEYGEVFGYGKTKAAAYADAASKVRNGEVTGQQVLQGDDVNGWRYRIDTRRDLK